VMITSPRRSTAVVGKVKTALKKKRKKKKSNMLRNIKQTLGLGRRGGCIKSRDEERNDLTNSTEESTS